MKNELLAEIRITQDRRGGEPMFKLLKSCLTARRPLESPRCFPSKFVEGFSNPGIIFDKMTIIISQSQELS